jgi:uncharacterized protein
MFTLRYKIKDIPSEGRVIDEAIARSLFVDALEGMQPDLEATSGHVHLELHKSNDDVFLRGTVKAQVVLPCASCLGPAHVAIDSKLKMTFVPEGEEPEESADPLDDLELGTHDLDTVDLLPIVREQIILGLPISPHCKDDCKGLCPTCGQNRNERDCGHREAEKLSPLADQLAKLNLHPKAD